MAASFLLRVNCGCYTMNVHVKITQELDFSSTHSHTRQPNFTRRSNHRTSIAPHARASHLKNHEAAVVSVSSDDGSTVPRWLPLPGLILPFPGLILQHD